MEASRVNWNKRGDKVGMEHKITYLSVKPAT